MHLEGEEKGVNVRRQTREREGVESGRGEKKGWGCFTRCGNGGWKAWGSSKRERRREKTQRLIFQREGKRKLTSEKEERKRKYQGGNLCIGTSSLLPPSLMEGARKVAGKCHLLVLRPLPPPSLIKWEGTLLDLLVQPSGGWGFGALVSLAFLSSSFSQDAARVVAYREASHQHESIKITLASRERGELRDQSRKKSRNISSTLGHENAMQKGKIAGEEIGRAREEA